MLSSRRAFVAWLAIGVLLLPAALGAVPAAPPAPSGVGTVPRSVSADLAPSSARVRAPSVRSAAPHVPATNSLTGSLADSPAPPAVSSPPVPTPASTDILAGWDALHLGTNSGIPNGWVPPDVIVAAGPDHVVEMVNLLIGVYSKNGRLVKVSALASFFNSGNDFISDPKIQYDPGSGRWFASVTDIAASQVLLAVSTSSDPSGTWHLYKVPNAATGECLDQPILGVGTATVIVSVNVFTLVTSPSLACVSPYLGAQYWVLNKGNLTAGVPSPAVYASTMDPLEGSIHPAQIQGLSADNYMIATYWPGTATTSNVLHLFTVSGTPPAPVTVTVASLSMPTASLPPAASQLGTKSSLDAGDIRVSDAAWAGGRMWLGFDEACLSDAARACIRLVQIDTGARTILQDFDIDVAGKHVFYPALRLDGAGDLGVAFGYSSPTDFPGIMVSGRVFADPVNTFQTPSVVVAGNGSEQTGCQSGLCRYGDYFGASLDPANASVIWFGGEIGTPSGWSTHVFAASVKAQLSYAYQVTGGGNGYGPPTVSFVHGGQPGKTVLGTTPSTILVDPGSAWSVVRQLVGSSSGEIWAVNGSAGAPPASGVANASASEIFDYFHQYRATLDFAVIGGGLSFGNPSVSVTVFGVPTPEAVPGTFFLDAGTAYAYPTLLSGSTSLERWRTTSASNGTVLGAFSLSADYYHQVRVNFTFTVLGASVGPVPQVHYSSLGTAVSVGLNATAWADSEAGYAYDSALAGASSTVRWGAGANGNGTVTVPGTISVLYREQFLIAVSSDPAALASFVTGSGWHDAGSSVTFSVAATGGWRFDRWSGDASGTAASITLTVQRPFNVTAVFDAGLTITAGDGGSISYAYGSTSGTVPAGTSLTIYVPVGTAVTLTAAPASFSQAFGEWSGAASGTAGTTTVQVTAPGTVTGSFGLNVLLIAGLSVALVAVILAVVLVVILRRRRRRPRA